MVSISHSGSVKSISDDDLCSDCYSCLYRPGGMSGCTKNWPGNEDADGYVIACDQHTPINTAIENWAYQATEEDIENVLRQNSLRVADTQGNTFQSMAETLIGVIDLHRVEKAALMADVDLDAQTKAANEEIRLILIEMGILSNHS